ncbi:MAG: hypothetical protein QG628_5 [Patescibacteria group bacterium]|nr:hypothetical protein [Patescibacteria group bacterium]
MHRNSHQSLVISHQLENIPSTKYYILNTFSGCGRAVYSLRTLGRTSQSFIPSPAFCIHFVRSLWVSKGLYTRVIQPTYPLLKSCFVSVNSDLCTLPTGLTIRTAFK